MFESLHHSLHSAFLNAVNFCVSFLGIALLAVLGAAFLSILWGVNQIYINRQWADYFAPFSVLFCFS